MSAADHARIVELASQRAVHRAFAWLHLHEPQLRRWQLECVAIPAPPFQEAERAQWFLQAFNDLGLAQPHIDAEGNVLAEIPSPGAAPDGPVILLSAHLDTVFPAGTDCNPREEDARILAPGACDNGAGLAALLGLAAALQHAALRPACTILFAANVGEEGEGDLRGVRWLFGGSPYAKRIAAAIALEGSGTNTVVDRALGSRRLRVTLEGPGGHSWADAGRPNPVVALSECVLAVSKLHLSQSPRTTLNWGKIQGGTSVNSIPAFAAADLDLRSTSPLQLDQTELAVLRLLDRTAAADAYAGLLLRIARIGDRAAGALPKAAALARSLRAVDRHLQLATDWRIGSTDANLPLSLGISAVAIGAGGTGGGIHTPHEWYDPTGRDLALRRVLLLLLDVCYLADAGIV